MFAYNYHFGGCKYFFSASVELRGKVRSKIEFLLRISLRNDSEGTMRLGVQYSWMLDSLAKCVEYKLRGYDSIRNENVAHLPCSSSLSFGNYTGNFTYRSQMLQRRTCSNAPKAHKLTLLSISLRNDSEGTMRLGEQITCVLDNFAKCEKSTPKE